jgi:translocation and assembly module TamA
MKRLWFVAAWLLLPLLGAAQGVTPPETRPDQVAPDQAAPAVSQTPPKAATDDATETDETPAAADTAAKQPSAMLAEAPATSDSAASAFSLEIVADDEIKTLLERHLELQRYRAIDDLSDNELTRLLDLARLEAQKLIATLGYFSPRIDIERQGSLADATPRKVLIRVGAGEPVQVTQVAIHFAGQLASDPQAEAQRQLIEASWLLPAGNRFTQARWSAAKQQALRQLTGERFPTGSIAESLADVDPVSRQARLDITLESGPAYRLGGITSTGLQRYDATLVRRLARLAPGSDYKLTALVAAQQRLVDSGFFSSVFVRIDPQSDPQAASVLVTVREAKLQKVTLGVGASTDSGARFSIEHLHNLVPGLGWRALSKIAIDRQTQTIGSELTAPPNEDGWRWSTSVQLQNEVNNGINLGSQRWRAGASQAGERIDRSYYLQYDRADSAASDTTAASIAESVSLNYAFTLRQFNTMPFPSDGWALGLELGGGSSLGTAPTPFGRVLTRWQSFWPLGRSRSNAPPDLRAGRLALRAQVGAVIAKDGISLPSTELFLAGGANSVRGYGLRGIGINLANGQVSAGRYLALGSVEWQRPIINKGLLTDWEGALFVDAGSVADKPADLHAQVGVGAGLRWKTPVGPLQIDLAYGVAVQKWRLHLNVGFVF